MSTINNINPTDRISDSRSVINDNFSNLNTDKAEKTDVQKNTYTYALATGSGNAFAVILDPAPTAYTIGMKVAFKANHTITGAATLNVNSLGAKTIKKNGEFDLEANDMEIDKIYEVIYDGTYFQLLSQLAKKQEEKDLKAFAQSPPSLTLRVTKGAVDIGGAIVYYAGGSSPTFTIPTTNPRIDLLVLNSSGDLEIIQGTEAASPSAPTYPTDKFVICEVYNRVSQTVIKNENDGVNGYIQKDVRAFTQIITIGFGDGSDGDVTISSNTTLTRDMYYNNLTVNSGVALDPGGYRIFVKETLTNNGTIRRNGNNGGNGGTSGYGSGGAALASGTLAGGVKGGNGGKGGDVNSGHEAGEAGISISGIGSNGAAGGAGGSRGSIYGGSGGAAGVLKKEILYLINSILPQGSYNGNMFGGSAGSGGGGGGVGGSSSESAGGGGGAGSNGGVIFIGAKTIVNNGAIECKGGNGGNGGNGYPGSDASGGGGGAGGSGGVIVLLYTSKSGSGSINVSGGTGGAGGLAGGSGGQNGNPGSNGNSGKIYEYTV